VPEVVGVVRSIAVIDTPELPDPLEATKPAVLAIDGMNG
jgi:hypothetical protein